MSFNTITTNSKTFNSLNDGSGRGLYGLNTLGFGDPIDRFKIAGGTLTTGLQYGVRQRFSNSTVTRLLANDVVVGSETIRSQSSVLVQFQANENTSIAQLLSLTDDIYDFVNQTDVLNRLLQGEQ